MIEFPTVSREFRSLVGRRREIQTLLGSVFAGLGIFLQNALQGGLPESLGGIRRHVFAFCAVLLMAPSLILALRMARLNAGLVLQGILFARLMRDQDFTPGWSIERAARLNVSGVSFLQFALMDLIAGFSAAILALALGASSNVALIVGAAIGVAWMALYVRFHRGAVRFALAKVEAEPPGRVTREQWQGHLSGSLEDCNGDLNANVAFVGLIVFSVFETLSGLGQARGDATDLAPAILQKYGPTAYVALMLTTCAMGLVAFIRVRLNVGRFSLLLDPTDRPFRPGQLTDSFLGYLILAFLLTVSLHLLLGLVSPRLDREESTLLMIDAAAFALAVILEQVSLLLAGRSQGEASRV